MTAADHYAWWREALVGRKGPIKDGEPQAGFYRTRVVRDGAWVPVAIFPYEGRMVATMGPNFSEPADVDRIWLSCADRPVTEADARHAASNGCVWPNELAPLPEIPTEAPAASIGDNNPPPDKETDEQMLERMSKPSAQVVSLIEQLVQQTAEAQAWFAKTPLRTKEHADLASDWCDRLSALNKKVEGERMAMRRPLMKALDVIQGWFKPTQDAADALAKKLDAAARKWAKDEERRLTEEARRKAEEERRRLEEERKKLAEEARRRQEEHERKLQEQGLPADAAPPPPPPPVLPLPEPEPFVAPKVMVGGASGRRRGAGSAKKEIRITDIDALLKHLRSHPDIIKLATKIAEVQAIKGGVDVPGVKIVNPDEEEAA